MKKLTIFIALLFSVNAWAQQPVQGTGTAGSPAGKVLSVQGVSSGTPQPVSAASGSVASGALASGSIASGACASGCVADGGVVTLGAKADAKNSATDTTAITVMQVLKEISSLEQAPASRAVTNVGTFATQSAITAASGSIASGALASGSIASGACASGCVADGGIVTLGAKADAKNAATDTTAITIMQVLKEISSLEQAPASRAVTNVGTFAVQATLQAGSALAGEVAPVATATTTDTSLRCVLVSAASTNATNCKGGSGNVYGFRFVNTSTTVYYLRMYNTSSSPTCSSATGFIESIPIPPAGAAGAAGGIVSIEPFGEGYSTGISFCFTGGSSSTDNTNAATGIFGTILYK